MSTDNYELRGERGQGTARFARLLAAPIVMLALILPLAGPASASETALEAVTMLDPLKIPKWVNQLDSPPPVYVPTIVYDEEGNVASHDYEIKMSASVQQILPPGYPPTAVWGYEGQAKDALTGEPLGNVVNSPGPSFEAWRGVPINVKWINNITEEHMFPVDPTLHWADPNEMMMPEPPYLPYPPGYPEAQYPVPLVTHLHGGEVQSTSDGGPDAWFTSNGLRGPGYSSTEDVPGSNWATFHYPNEQPTTTLWYHDHALGITRINVMSGLAGFYLLRDKDDPIAPLLPKGKYDMPIVIQDRTFMSDGSMLFDTVGVDPGVHPYWMPEFFGNAIMVNGKVWPNMNVDQGEYRFRLLDGSNARFYTVSLVNMKNMKPIAFTVIGSDGGYLRAPSKVLQLTIAPGERYDILVDFSNIKPGTKIIMKNSAKTPFPDGTAAKGATTGQLIQFTVTGSPGPAQAALPATLNEDLSVFPSLPTPEPEYWRTLVLTEVMGPLGPTEVLLNGLKWHFPVTELPVVGSTEEWVIVNPTADTHPIHLHLTQFQLVSRQRMDTAQYFNDWVAKNGEMMPPFHEEPEELDPTAYLKGVPMPANTWEQGWKDTVQMNPGEVTIIRVRFAATATPIGAPVDEFGNYPFDPTEGPGYVWHCHILEHEDNEMMRPYLVVAAPDT